MKRILNLGFRALLPRSREQPLPYPCTVRRVLLVRVNFRMGNAVLTTALVPILQARFPQAAIDILATEATAPLLSGLGFARMHVVSRRHLRQPWRFIQVIRQLRQQRFDVAIDGGLGSFSGVLYGRLAGACWRIGRRGRHDHFLNVRLPLPPPISAYHAARDLARALGVAVDARPTYALAADEARAARAALDRWKAESPLFRLPCLGVFVGGHAHKRWPRPHWLELLTTLDAQNVPALVFAGPEERDFAAVLAARDWVSIRVVPPQSLRRFAALVAQTSLLITPDSGPMHLAAALGVPVLALLPTERSRFYVPTGEQNAVLIAPQPIEVVAALRRMHGGTPFQTTPAHTRAAPGVVRESVFSPRLSPTIPSS